MKEIFICFYQLEKNVLFLIYQRHKQYLIYYNKVKNIDFVKFCESKKKFKRERIHLCFKVINTFLFCFIKRINNYFGYRLSAFWQRSKCSIILDLKYCTILTKKLAYFKNCCRKYCLCLYMSLRAVSSVTSTLGKLINY